MTSRYAGSLPLIRHFAAGQPIACVDGRIINAQQFIRHAEVLAAELPQGRYVLNLCEDRYRFLVGFAAALITRQTTLLPSSRAPGAIAQIQARYSNSYCLYDQALPSGLHGFLLPDLATDTSEEKLVTPHVPSQQEAAILFTSGSTGEPAAHSKTWGTLVQGADQLRRAFGIAPRSHVVGTIPPQHMFGLESTIIFPMQSGCAIHPGQPHLPADIDHAVIAAQAPLWLMTTPMHLRACVIEGTRLSGISGAISATMPLGQATAQAAEQVLNCPLHEIYGCTEAGIVATRQPARDTTWRLCPDFRLRQDADHSWLLEGARVAQPLRLGDDIMLEDTGLFTLQGRVGDMIKIAGKRMSLGALNAELLAIGGVKDGTFFRSGSDETRNDDDHRLAAFVVADQLQIHQVIDALRKRIDSVFIPRPIWKVAQLPRDAHGKLPHAALASLAAALSADATNAGARDCEHTVAPDHPALAIASTPSRLTIRRSTDTFPATLSCREC
jgi:acyl-coenzyme A synthetase/AMP-(fatty) acid ligase